MHYISLILMIFSLNLYAEESLEAIEVINESERNFSEFWEENKGTQIFSGKKNTVTSLKEIPRLQTNNYRQATSQTPGLLISEIPNEALAAITYRGLGDPHESYNLLLLQDGTPVAADMYGYPAHYYSPALPMMDKVQFIRGGAGLLYGPQPGGVLNYMSHPLLRNQKTSGKVGLTGGSYNLLTTNNALFGSTGNHSYGIEYYRRQGDGPQRKNSDFFADYLQIRSHSFSGNNKYKVTFNGYHSDHGSSGGFAKNPGANTNVFGENQKIATREHDRLKVDRAELKVGLEKKLADASELHVNVWANAYNRYSKVQNGGGFGTFPTANNNLITTQKYYGYNGEIRYLKNYSAFGNEHTFSGGLLHYNLLSPIHTERGEGANSNHGATLTRLNRATHTNSLFMENRFSFNRLMITPGVRLESIRQKIDEREKTVAGEKRNSDITENVPLFGLGLSYHLSDDSQLYANASESYKPVTWSETVPNIANSTVSKDISPSRIHNYELGYRGQTKKLNWDLSAFYIRYEDKFGLVGTNYQNTGAGTNQGIDSSLEAKVLKDFSWYGSIALLDAQFTNGPLKGKTPQYAPKTLSRTGLIYRKESKLKLALMAVFVGRHYGDDSNSDNFEIPPYTVFDLTGDWRWGKNWVFSGGINNLLDKNYYSRVRTDGIAWSLGRNLYAGASYEF